MYIQRQSGVLSGLTVPRHKGVWVMKAHHHTFFTSELDGYSWSVSWPDRLNPGKLDLRTHGVGGWLGFSPVWRSFFEINRPISPLCRESKPNLNSVPPSPILNLITIPAGCTICLYLAVLSSWNSQDRGNS